MPPKIPPIKINSVGLIAKRNLMQNPRAMKLVKDLVEYLKKHKREVFYDSNCAQLFPHRPGRNESNNSGYSKEQLMRKVDLVITLGGDGTLLKTARRISHKKVLILGVNLGNLGFLTECNPEKVFECLSLILQGKYHTDKRSILRATVYRDGKKIYTFLALNDAVINQGAFARLIEMDLEVDARKLVKFKADGLIISTPTGSTAHSLSAGGPIVHPYIEGLIVTPICPSSLAMRPIIIPDKKQLTVTVETRRREQGEQAANIGLTIDGQDVIMLQYGDKIKFRRSKRQIYLARTRHQYYKMLRSKLNWG